MPIATPQGTLDFKSVDKVTFVGASSNTVIDTTTGSLGVGVDVNGPTSNLHVVGHTRLEGDIDMLHTSNTASIKLNSNVVTEFPRSKKLMKFPRVVLNSASQDGYVVTASTDGYVSTKFHRYDPFRPFVSGTGTNSANGWHSGPPDISIANNWDQTFDTSGYNKDVTSYGVGGYAGTSIAGIESEWLKLELPHKIVLSHFYYQQRDGQSINYGQAPRDFRILGSNDDVDWDTIQTFTDQTSLPEGKILTAEASKGYKYLAFVVTKTWVTSGTSHLTLKNLEYYGVPEYDPEAHGTDVVVKSIPNVPNTDWLQVYYDAKNYTSGTITDESPNNYVGTLNGNTQLETVNGIKAFKFDGNTDTITGTVSGISGEYVHSIAFWIKLENIANMAYTLFEMGARSENDLIGIYIGSTSMNYYFYNNDNTYSFKNPLTDDSWYHLTVTYSGGSSLSHRKVYLDGDELYRTAHAGGSTSALTLANGTFAIGDIVGGTGNNDFKGSVANFRLFNRSLTSDEIWQLYAYQKEYFGHGDLSMTLKAGRLGIGTLEPRAALDVRGVIRGPGLSIQTVSSTKTDTSFFSGTSITDIGGLSITIQPKFANSKIYVGYHLLYGGWGRNFFRLKRTQGSSTSYFQSDLGPNNHASTGRATTTDAFGNDDASTRSGSFFTLDVANGLEPITYTVQGWTYHGSYYVTVNRGYNDGYAGIETYRGRGASSITAQEVCQ